MYRSHLKGGGHLRKVKSELVLRKSNESSKKSLIISIPFRTYMFRKPLPFNSSKLVFKNVKH